jgi:hypothetical protein
MTKKIELCGFCVLIRKEDKRILEHILSQPAFHQKTFNLNLWQNFIKETVV